MDLNLSFLNVVSGFWEPELCRQVCRQKHLSQQRMHNPIIVLVISPGCTELRSVSILVTSLIKEGRKLHPGTLEVSKGEA